MSHPNHIDIPAMVVVVPILAIEFWYWFQPVEKRRRVVNRVEGFLIFGLLLVLVARLFTNWGDHYF